MLGFMEKSKIDWTADKEWTLRIVEVNAEIGEKYALLTNDAIIVATCKYYEIQKIATFDEDFKKVDFIEIIDSSL